MINFVCKDQPYERGDNFGDRTEHEERGLPVITHGNRTGRIYATEYMWSKRTCNECQFVERHSCCHQSDEWRTI